MAAQVPVSTLTIFMNHNFKTFVEKFPLLTKKQKKAFSQHHNTFEHSMEFLLEHIMFLETNGKKDEMLELLNTQNQNQVDRYKFRTEFEIIIEYCKAINILNNNDINTVNMLNELNNIKQLLHF